MSNRASFFEAANVALDSLRGSKLRSFLTLLGIILATTTLIAVMAVINGMNRYIANEGSTMGVDGFRVRRIIMLGQFDAKKYMEMERKRPELSREEFLFVREEARLLREWGMEVGRSGEIKFGGKALNWVGLNGVTANIGVIGNLQPVLGRYFSEGDNARRLPVAFIGNDVREELFPGVDPVGKTIAVDGRPFEVIGVAKAMGSLFGQSRDNFVQIPIETFFKIYGPRKGIGYTGLAIDQAHLYEAQDEVRSLIRAYRGLKPSEEDTFSMVDSDSLVSTWQSLTGAVAATAVAVVSIFLVVGGVVIMNIMLAVVSERTREIGIRKSVGARSQDILNQFLVESAVLAASGGMLGVLIAYAISILMNAATPIPMAVPLSAVFIGVGLSAAVGLFFGIYPARRAARLDPIEALRYE